ncbi:MAG: hypothetical protein GWN17_15430 [Candidatus Korarchaeota archaeon]|nr:hypothetical protein [Candidatus Thorarchaeota archaeon]NIW53572.1 hypothetical protein [Candidatus Korarchaeota archaeon]
MINPPKGCRFHPRCPYVFNKCKKVEPPLFEPERGRAVKCFKYE